MIVAAIVAMFVAAWIEECGYGYHLGFVSVYFCSALGIFYGIEAVVYIVTKRRQNRFDTIRFRKGIDYKQAA